MYYYTLRYNLLLLIILFAGKVNSQDSNPLVYTIYKVEKFSINSDGEFHTDTSFSVNRPLIIDLASNNPAIYFTDDISIEHYIKYNLIETTNETEDDNYNYHAISATNHSGTSCKVVFVNPKSLLADREIYVIYKEQKHGFILLYRKDR